MQQGSKNVVRVAIPRPIYQTLDYFYDEAETPNVGARVRVSLGNSVTLAIIVEVDVESEFKALKPIHEIIDKKPLLDDSMMALLQWASRYYFYPIGEVLFHAIPTALRKGKSIPKLELWTASETGLLLDSESLKRAPKQHQMLLFLNKNEADALQLQNQCGSNWRNCLKQLLKKGLVNSREVEDEYVFSRPETTNKERLTLTKEQQKAIGGIKPLFATDKPKPILLHGVTGSGKTEVYLRSIESILESGKQVLVLIPEIGLTPQLLFRFQQHFPQYTTASLHSALADSDRMRVWLGAQAGSIDIVIGTRSAIFTPMKNLGGILIDEEHDASFKQQEGFLYQGRDIAIKRAHELGIPVLLGSATPSLESLHNVNRGRYHYLRLDNRPGKFQAPSLTLQDVRTLPMEAGVSSLMMNEIRQHLNNNNQVMLFLNRRGFSPVLLCPACGWHAICDKCERGMTYHAAAKKIICHHCSYEEQIKSVCPDCGSDQITTQGYGTERIESVLNSHFPDTKVIRIDRDSTSKKGSLEKKLDVIRTGEPLILIGTQMLTKGHDFPKLTLVGILDVDQALFSMDFRAQERLVQQVLQVAGRAGRGIDKGQVILQTSQPQHPLLMDLLSLGYAETAEKILNERSFWSYPPIGSQALIRVSASEQNVAMEFISSVASKLRIEITELSFNELELLGPMSSPLARRANRYRFQLLLSAKQRGMLHQVLTQALLILSSSRKKGSLRWVIDVDPVDFL